jgi:hypothetical protein
MPADGEAKPRTTVFARRRGRGLRKLLKQLSHLLFGHANPGVGHRNDDLCLLRLGGDGDGTFLGALVGIARQIKQRLAKPDLFGLDRAEVHRYRRQYDCRSSSPWLDRLATSSISGASGTI